MADVGMKWSTLRYARLADQKGKGEFPKINAHAHVMSEIQKSPAQRRLEAGN